MKKFLGYLKMKYEMWLINQIDKHDLGFIFEGRQVEKLEFEIHELEEENDHLLNHLLWADERIYELEEHLDFYEPWEGERED